MLFAMYYFELIVLPEEIPLCVNVHFDATEYGHELIFLHVVKPGPASQSYGLHVAELAGVPRDVVERAREYLRRLEKHQQTLLPASPQSELKFDAPAAPALRDEQRAALEKIAALDVDALTPRAALELLYELHKRAK